MKNNKALITISLTAAAMFGCTTGRNENILLSLNSEYTGQTAQGTKPNDLMQEVPASKLEKISGEYDLLAVINKAVSNNLALRAEFLRREEAKGTIMSARAAAYPKLDLEASATSDLIERGENPDTYGASLTLNQPLWRSGAISAGITYADLYAANINEDIRSKMQDVVAMVSEDYLQVLLSQKMVEVYQESLRVSERMLDTAQKKRKAGTASDYEVLRAEVEVATSKAALIKEQNALRTAGIRLLQDMGVDQSSRIAIKGTLKFEPETYNITAATINALGNRPDILKALASVAMANEELNVVKSEYGPSANLFATGKYENPDPNNKALDEWNHDASVGVSISYKLFDGLERRGKMKQAESKLSQSKAALLNTEENARVEIVRAMLDISNAAELYVSQSKNIDLSNEAIRMLENGFNVGKNTQIEVLDARSALTEAMGRYYDAVYSHCIAKIALRKAMGTLVSPAAESSTLSRNIKINEIPF